MVRCLRHLTSLARTLNRCCQALWLKSVDILWTKGRRRHIRAPSDSFNMANKWNTCFLVIVEIICAYNTRLEEICIYCPTFDILTSSLWCPRLLVLKEFDDPCVELWVCGWWRWMSGNESWRYSGSTRLGCLRIMSHLEGTKADVDVDVTHVRVSRVKDEKKNPRD